jgi:hypothetical protein
MNRPEIRRLIKKYKRMRHARHFEMPVFAVKTDCGTACCIAGQVLLDKGYRPRWEDAGWRARELELGWQEANYFTAPSGRKVHAFNAAQRELGLTREQADRLFLKSEWPYRFWLPDSPKLAAERLQHFLDTNGRE